MFVFCNICDSQQNVFDDETTGDCICINCATVINRECSFRVSFDTSTHSNVYNNIQTDQRKILRICDKYSISTSIISTVEEWLQRNLARSSMKNIRTAVCVINLFEFHSAPTVSMTSIRSWSSKMSVDESEVTVCLQKMNALDIHTESTNNCEKDWIVCLQKRCFQLLTDVFTIISMERKTSFKIKKECTYIVNNKASFSIVGIDYVSACILYHLFQEEYENIEDILVVSLRLNKKKFKSISKLLYSK
uniref:Uncharacterized protein n=1 Tax=viral metagenome TaxID=1070528 RepID=A0A6C0BQY0_9ZZZZ